METMTNNAPGAVPPHYLVVMGVSGTGKTTVAATLAERMNWAFQEGDDLHPLKNVEKMRSGHPLTDEDRLPWLKLCHDWLSEQVRQGRGAVLTCSALKRCYRDALSCDLPVQFVYLYTAPEVLADRLEHRTGHYMPASLLPSQLAILEEPAADEPVIRISGTEPPELLVEHLIERLKQEQPAGD